MISHENGRDDLESAESAESVFSRPTRYWIVGSKQARRRCSSLNAGNIREMDLDALSRIDGNVATDVVVDGDDDGG